MKYLIIPITLCHATSFTACDNSQDGDTVTSRTDAGADSDVDTASDLDTDTGTEKERADWVEPEPIDVEATEAAVDALRETLDRLAEDTRMAFGHEDTTAYGVGWWGEPDQSDVKRVCGSHAAVYGWDLGDIGYTTNLDGVPFDDMRALIENAHALGGINTVSWHMDNLVTGSHSWDRSVLPVDAILPGGAHHDAFLEKLDFVANFFQRCRGEGGALVPIIFRPFHEHTGGWFWWGMNSCTEEQYISLFQFTIDYLRDEKGLVNLLVAFSPSAFSVSSAEDYLIRYPGDDYVDIMGVDHYFGNTRGAVLVSAAEHTVAAAEVHGKWAALTEFGIDGTLAGTLTDATRWFTRDFLEPLKASDAARRLTYALTWRNEGETQFYVPYPGHPAEADFLTLCEDPFTIFQADLPL